MRARAFRVAVVAATVASACVVTPATDAQTSGPAQASTQLIVSPAHDAVVTGPAVRVVVRRVSGARTRAFLNGRDVTSRFSRKGSRLVGRLTHRQRLRAGGNHLVVAATRGGRAEMRQAHTFFVVRRASFVRVKVTRGPAARAVIDVVSGARAVELRRRPRSLRVRLNGRSVTRSAERLTGTRHAVSLSRSHGLRHGVNRLSVRVTEPSSGRYALVEQRFRVRRTHPLAAAGLDQTVWSSRPVRIGGHARAASGGQLRYRWRLVRRPAGSRARIEAPTRARPLLVPDRPGHYVAEQRVSELRRGARSAQVSGTAVDHTTVVHHPEPLISLSANAFAVDPRGIQLREFFPHPGDGATIQWLKVDRATLELGRNEDGTTRKEDNAACCSGNQQKPLSALTEALEDATSDELVIITVPPNRITLGREQYGEFNEALERIGVEPLPNSVLDPSDEQLTIVGIPGGGEGSGWVIRRGVATPSLPTLGWLMVDGAQNASSGDERTRFHPLTVGFTTRVSASSTSTRNVMDLGGVEVDSNDTPGFVDAGFHVVEIDPRDLRVVKGGNNFFGTNSSSSSDTKTVAMADFVNAARGRGNYVAVQSVGSVGPPPGGDRSAWLQLVDAMASMGANPDKLHSPTGGSYAFIGGPPLTRREVEQSSDVIAGRARMRPDGFMDLEERAAPTGTLNQAIFSRPIAWPFTPGGGPEGTDYDASRRAIAYITGCLSELKDYAPDVRQAYFEQPDADWLGARDDLGHIYYPGAAPSSDPLARPCEASVPVGFTSPQFAAVLRQLNTEFGMIAQAEKLMTLLRRGFNDSEGKQLPYLSSTGEALRDALKPPDTEILAPILGLLAAVSEIAGEAVPEIGPYLHLVADAYEIGTAAAEAHGDVPVGEQIEAKVSELAGEVQTSISDASENLQEILAVGVSDWGRLQALDKIASARGLPRQKAIADNLTVGAKAYFSTVLLPLAYETWSLVPAPAGSSRIQDAPTPATCFNFDGSRFREKPNPESAPENAWVPFRLPYATGSLVLGRSSLQIPFAAFPPESVTQPMFAPLDPPEKLGIDKSNWFWGLGAPARTYDCFTGR